MAIIRLKPTSYTTDIPSDTAVQNPGSVLNGLGPEDASNYYTYAGLRGYYGSYTYRQSRIILSFSIPALESISKVTVKARIASYNASSSGAYISIPKSSIAISNLEGFYSIYTDPTEAQNYMAGGTTNYSQHEITDPTEIEYFLNKVASDHLIVYSGRGNVASYVSGIVIDIEYYPSTIKIGANELDGAFLGRSWIEKIYKGAALLFDKSTPPYTYTTLRYIQGTGTQYIDTGIKMNSSVNIEADAEIRQFAWQKDNAPTDLAGIFGNINCGDAGGNRAGLRFYTQRNYYWYYGNTGWPTVWPSDETFYSRNIYKNIGNVFYINGTSTITGTAGTWSDATNNALLFSMGENPKAGMKLYGAKLYDNGTLVRDFVPSKRNDGVVGLYDNVTNTFFTNAGTGVFYEPIPDEYQEVEYIQSSGNNSGTGQYIDTGYCPQQGDRIRVNITFTPLISSSTIGASWKYRMVFSQYGNGCAATLIGQTGNGFVNTDVFRYSPSSVSVGTKTYVDGEWTSTGTTDRSMYLFAQNEGSSYYDTSIKLYAFTLGVNEQVIRNYVPCYRKSDGVIGLYDTINREFKVNQGVGSFTKGPDVN